MNINVTYGKGRAFTEKAAFDKALYDAGIGHYNLVELSSVIPPNTSVIVEKKGFEEGKVGDKLYLVISKATEHVEGKEAWAGLGWSTETDFEGGIFVEQDGSSKEEVEDLLDKFFVQSMGEIDSARPREHGEVNMKTIGLKCKDKPVSAVVAAVYEHEGWNK